MNWKSFIAGVGVGIIGGYAAKELLTQKTIVSPERVLTNAKSIFKNKGPISGSWIHMQAEPYEKNGLRYKVYKGGITRTFHGTTEQFEFIADATTGTLLETEKL